MTSTRSLTAAQNPFITLLGNDHVRPATPTDAVSGVNPQLILEPANEQELAQVLKLANQAGLTVIPLGGGTKLNWGNPPSRADILLSTARLNRIIEHAWADLTVTVEAGCTINTLQDALAQHGQRLAFDPLWPSRATVGGVLSTNDSGALRLRFGALRDLIIGVTLALPDGTLASSGGKVVKNVAGYDLPKLATGALGTLGVITRAIFRLHSRPKETRTISCLPADVFEAQRLLLAVQDSKLAHSALQLRFIENVPQPRLDVLFEATKIGLDAQTKTLTSLISPIPTSESGPSVWNARQELYDAAKRDAPNSAIAKFSVLPNRIAGAISTIATLSVSRARCAALVQANGLGVLHLQGEPATLAEILKSFRSTLESTGASLVIHHSPGSPSPLNAWGAPSDALPLMRVVKQQFDPQDTLNPGRFLGGI